jgi:hypothetical protein
MPFPEPETALTSTIDRVDKGKPHPQIYRAPCGVLEGVYVFSITTKTQ